MLRIIYMEIDSSDKVSENHTKKRKSLLLIDKFYSCLKSNDLVYISDIRRVIPSPSNRNILELIQEIQDRPYIYIKQIGRNTLLKLSTHARDPKVRYVQIVDLLKFVEDQQERIKRRDQKEIGKSKELFDEYRQFVDSMRLKLIELRENKKTEVRSED